jgi:hypothetical protein
MTRLTPRHRPLWEDVLVRLVDYLDKGASLGAEAPCLTMNGKDFSYGQLSYRIAHGLANSGHCAR